jgi:hypothetical protein
MYAIKLTRSVEVDSWVDEAAEHAKRLVDPGPRIAMKIREDLTPMKTLLETDRAAWCMTMEVRS